MLDLLLLVSLCGTPSLAGADSVDCTVDDLNRPQIIVQARLWRALRWSGGMPVLMDSLPASGGVEVCFPVDTTVAATYWMSSVDAEGQESCLGRGLSFPQTVGVGSDDSVPDRGLDGEHWYDLRGARLPHKPTQPGVYWVRKYKDGRAVTRKILVFVRV